MTATVDLTGYDVQKTGHMEGETVSVEEVTSLDKMQELPDEDRLVKAFARSGPAVATQLKLRRDPDTAE